MSTNPQAAAAAPPAGSLAAGDAPATISASQPAPPTAVAAQPEGSGSEAFVTPMAVLTVDESQYQAQLQAKLAKLRALFAEFDPPELEVFESPPSHYRMRAEFHVEQRDGELHYVMFDRGGGGAEGAAPAAAEGGEAAASGAQEAGGGGEQGDAEGTAAGEQQEAAAAAEGKAAEAGKAAGKAKSAKKRKAGGGKKGGGAKRVRVESFPVASRQVNELMAAVREACAAEPLLRERLFQANFHTTLAGDAMVTLLYHRKLGPEWAAAAAALRAKLAATPTAAAAGAVPHVIGRSRGQALCVEAGHVIERLAVAGRTYVQKQVEGSFSQPNGAVCQHMLAWAQDVTRPAAAQQGPAAAADAPGSAGSEAAAADAPGTAEGAEGATAAHAAAAGPQTDLLELYCGNGNFTIPLAQNFRHVVATEVAKSGVEAAKYNLEANGVSNVFLARMASEEFAVTMRERGARRRLAAAGLPPWDELRLRTILVDPPRAGLDAFTVELLKEFDAIVYISCNPDTLAANLRALGPSHRVARFAAFDQFPYTHHLEAGVYLVRR